MRAMTTIEATIPTDLLSEVSDFFKRLNLTFTAKAEGAKRGAVSATHHNAEPKNTGKPARGAQTPLNKTLNNKTSNNKSQNNTVPNSTAPLNPPPPGCVFVNQPAPFYITAEEKASLGYDIDREPLPADRLVRSTNPGNPSPTGDRWFDDPRNIAMLDKGLEDSKAGRAKVLDFEELDRQMFALGIV